MQGKPIQKEWKVEEKYFGFKPFRIFLKKTHRGNIEFLDEYNRVRKKIAFQKDRWEEFDYFYSNSTELSDTFYQRKLGEKVMIRQVISSGNSIQSEKLLSPPEADEWERKMGFQEIN